MAFRQRRQQHHRMTWSQFPATLAIRTPSHTIPIMGLIIPILGIMNLKGPAWLSFYRYLAR